MHWRPGPCAYVTILVLPVVFAIANGHWFERPLGADFSAGQARTVHSDSPVISCIQHNDWTRKITACEAESIG